MPVSNEELEGQREVVEQKRLELAATRAAKTEITTEQVNDAAYEALQGEEAWLESEIAFEKNAIAVQKGGDTSAVDSAVQEQVSNQQEQQKATEAAIEESRTDQADSDESALARD